MDDSPLPQVAAQALDSRRNEKRKKKETWFLFLSLSKASLSLSIPGGWSLQAGVPRWTLQPQGLTGHCMPCSTRPWQPQALAAEQQPSSSRLAVYFSNLQKPGNRVDYCSNQPVENCSDSIYQGLALVRNMLYMSPPCAAMGLGKNWWVLPHPVKGLGKNWRAWPHLNMGLGKYVIKSILSSNGIGQELMSSIPSLQESTQRWDWARIWPEPLPGEDFCEWEKKPALKELLPGQNREGCSDWHSRGWWKFKYSHWQDSCRTNIPINKYLLTGDHQCHKSPERRLFLRLISNFGCSLGLKGDA